MQHSLTPCSKHSTSAHNLYTSVVAERLYDNHTVKEEPNSAKPMQAGLVASEEQQ